MICTAWTYALVMRIGGIFYSITRTGGYQQFYFVNYDLPTLINLSARYPASLNPIIIIHKYSTLSPLVESAQQIRNKKKCCLFNLYIPMSRKVSISCPVLYRHGVSHGIPTSFKLKVTLCVVTV